MPVYVWAIDTAADFFQSVQLGATAVISDDVSSLLPLRAVLTAYIQQLYLNASSPAPCPCAAACPGVPRGWVVLTAMLTLSTLFLTALAVVSFAQRRHRRPLLVYDSEETIPLASTAHPMYNQLDTRPSDNRLDSLDVEAMVRGVRTPHTQEMTDMRALT